MKIPANSIMAKSIEGVGYLRAGKLLQVIACWAWSMSEVDPWPEGLSHRVWAYRDNWLMSDRTAWRHLELFRQAFPDEGDPTRIAGLVLDAYRSELATREDARRMAASGRFALLVP